MPKGDTCQSHQPCHFLSCEDLINESHCNDVMWQWQGSSNLTKLREGQWQQQAAKKHVTTYCMMLKTISNLKFHATQNFHVCVGLAPGHIELDETSGSQC
jgi:hypothetical protein